MTSVKDRQSSTGYLNHNHKRNDLEIKLEFGVKYETENGERRQHACLYLHCSNNGKDEQWSLPCEVQLTMKKAVGKGVTLSYSETFNKTIRSWGWPRFVKWEELMDPEQGFLVNDALTIQAVITFPLLTEEEEV